MSEWQPARIAPVNPCCPHWGKSTKPERWVLSVGKIIRVRPWIGPYRHDAYPEEKAYEIHPDDLHIVGTTWDARLVCEHHIQTD